MVNDERQRRINIAGAKAVIEAIDAVVAQSKAKTSATSTAASVTTHQPPPRAA